MENNGVISIQCTYCEKENKVNLQRIRDMVLCNFCGDVLFELDYNLKDIRLTKRFGELYRILIPQLGEIRKMIVQFDKEIKLQYCRDSDQFGAVDRESIVPGKNLSGTLLILKNLINENQVSDPETGKSMNDLFIHLNQYIESVQEFCGLFDGKKSASELKNAFLQIRSLEKEVNAFVRMMSSYLGETAIQL
ncbi:MAG: hypothetical protein OEZ34_00225 [Spirochaetia bacterium]|nr:hypothetical protein [Spirochaetia bacterium]